MPPELRRVSSWKILGVLAGCGLASLLALGVWASVRGNRNYAAAKDHARIAIAQIRDRDPRRPVLRGRSEPGNAWEDYSAALGELRKFN